MSQFIVAAFDGAENSSRMVMERLDVCSECKLLLPNDKQKSAEVLAAAVQKHDPACVILMGQKPVIRDKIAVETTAELCREERHTKMDAATVEDIIRGTGYGAYISCGCGTSYCNNIYWHALGMGMNTIFLHVPSKKNISDMNALVKAVQAVMDGLAGVPAML